MARIVVVGGGAAGMSAASAARRIDPALQVVVLERTNHVAYGMCGLPYFLSGVTERAENLFSYTVDFFREQRGLDVRLGAQLTELDPVNRRVRYTDGAQSVDLDYDSLVLASGADPVVPPIDGADEAGVYTIRKMEDCVALRASLDGSGTRRAVVVGGGYVGLEMAEALATRGISVTLAEMTPQLMPGFDPSIGESVLGEMQEHGVDVRLSTTLRGIRKSSAGLSVGLNGDEVNADVVILALGVRPNVDVAVRAGATTGPAGALLVDDSMRTNLPGVYAAGDCIAPHHLVLARPAYVPLGPTANKTGRVAGTVAAGGRACFRGIVGTMVVKIFDLTVASTGITFAQAAQAGLDPTSTGVTSKSRARYYPGAEPISIRLVHQPDGRLLGAQIAGRDGVAKRIDVIATALHAGFSIDDLADLDLAYAPPYSPVYDPILVAAQAGQRTMATLSGPVRRASARHAPVTDHPRTKPVISSAV